MTSQQLNEALDARDLSQRWLAQQLGISAMTVSRWSRGVDQVPVFREPQIRAALESVREKAA